jgi:ceramide glucosyltransferase
MILLEAFGVLVLAMAVAGVAYTLAAAHFVGRLRPQGRPDPGVATPVTLLKPLCGSEGGLLENLSTFVGQDYPAPVQIVFGVQDPADPALTAVEALRRAHPQADIAVVVDARVHGANRKVSNLMNMVGQARHDLVVLNDADIAVEPDYLLRVAAALTEPGVGAVTCYYRGEARAGLWSRLGAMGVSYGFLANVALGVGLGMARPCMGSTIALRRDTLEAIGGFAALSDVLMDDFEIGRRVRAAGLRVALPQFVVRHGCSEASLGELIAHELRWAVTVRMIDPVGHFGSVVTHAAPLAVIGVLLLGPTPIALAVLAAAVGARLWLKCQSDRAAGASSGPLALMPVRDTLSFAIYMGSLFARAVYWRGARFRVSSGRRFFPA